MLDFRLTVTYSAKESKFTVFDDQGVYATVATLDDLPTACRTLLRGAALEFQHLGSEAGIPDVVDASVPAERV